MFGLGDVPSAIVDEFVVMRRAQMTPAVRAKAEKRAIKKYQGNGGCDALCKKHGKKTMMEMVEEEVQKQKPNFKLK